jgi:LMBR1 domain-containing protein 1
VLLGIVAYGLIVSFCFFWIPLSYFYFEELADEEQTMIQRLWTSFKYTTFFVLVACALLLTGLLMKPNRHEGIDLDWLRKALTDLGMHESHPFSPRACGFQLLFYSTLD